MSAVWCSICFDTAAADKSDHWSALRCGHYFHTPCLEHALFAGHQRACPICREKVPHRGQFRLYHSFASLGLDTPGSEGLASPATDTAALQQAAKEASLRWKTQVLELREERESLRSENAILRRKVNEGREREDRTAIRAAEARRNQMAETAQAVSKARSLERQLQSAQNELCALSQKLDTLESEKRAKWLVTDWDLSRDAIATIAAEIKGCKGSGDKQCDQFTKIIDDKNEVFKKLKREAKEAAVLHHLEKVELQKKAEKHMKGHNKARSDADVLLKKVEKQQAREMKLRHEMGELTAKMKALEDKAKELQQAGNFGNENCMPICCQNFAEQSKIEHAFSEGLHCQKSAKLGTSDTLVLLPNRLVGLEVIDSCKHNQDDAPAEPCVDDESELDLALNSSGEERDNAEEAARLPERPATEAKRKRRTPLKEAFVEEEGKISKSANTTFEYPITLEVLSCSLSRSRALCTPLLFCMSSSSCEVCSGQRVCSASEEDVQGLNNIRVQ